MMWKRRAFPDPGWYDPAFAPSAPVSRPPPRTPPPPAQQPGVRRKIPVGDVDITTIGGPVSKEPPAEPKPAAIARRERDSIEQVHRPQPVAAPTPPPAPRPPQSSQPPAAHVDPEVEALKRRLERDAARSREQDRRALLASILPVLDNLDRSVAAAAASPDRALVEGVRVVRDQLQSALADLGAVRIDSLGKPFNPAIHEAIATADVDDPQLDGMVIDEWEAGYRLGDRVLRPARVRVGKLSAGLAPDEWPEGD